MDRTQAQTVFASLPDPKLRYGLGIQIQLKDFDFTNIPLEATTSCIQVQAPAPVEVIQSKAIEENQVPIDESKFTALFYSILEQATIIRIPKATKLSEPIHIKVHGTQASNAEKIIILAETQCQATIITETSSSAGCYFLGQTLEIYAEEGAAVKTYSTQECNDTTHVLNLHRGEVAQHASIHWVDATLGGKFAQQHMKTKLKGPEAVATKQSFFLASKQQQFDLDDVITHYSKHSHSSMHNRGILNDKAKTIYRATVNIQQQAKKCTGHQKAENLLLSEDVRCNAVPILEVDNDEVVCSHGATFTQVNEEKLFYLTSRGLSNEEARETIVTGFVHPVIQSFPDEKVQERITKKVFKNSSKTVIHETCSTLDTDTIRRDFPILQSTVRKNPLVYLDNSASSQKPQQVIKAITQYYETSNANVHRGIHHLSEKASIAYEQARITVANFLKADAEEIIFTKGTTESLNLLAYTLSKQIKEGDEIVITEMEHHSNLVPWQQVAKAKGAILKYIPITKDYRLDLEQAQALITARTKIVSCCHMSNTLGTINPIKELAALAHEVGALLILDAAQSAPHLNINVKELNCDYLAFSGHKMCGPTGVGVLYGKKALLEQLPPFHYGGGMISEVSFETTSWGDSPERFEAGTPNIAQAIGLAEAINYLQMIGMDKIEAHEKTLTTYALKQLKEVKNLHIIGPKTAENRGAVLTFTIDDIHAHDIAEILNRFGIAVRAGHHCTMPLHKKLNLTSTTRASFYLYNTKEEVDTLVRAVQRTQEIFQ